MIILQIITLVAFLVMLTGLFIGISTKWRSVQGPVILAIGGVALIFVGIFGWGIIAGCPSRDGQCVIYWKLKKLTDFELVAYDDTHDIRITDAALVNQLKGSDTAPIIKSWCENLYGTVYTVRYTLNTRAILLYYPLKTPLENAPK